MNAVTKVRSQQDVISVMQSSLYPGARSESVAMVLGYCQARGLDPLLKPVHIVPMYIKEAGSEKGSMRDVVLPGIALYRIQAARTGNYAGKDEPEFGPDVTRKIGSVEVTYPQWCKVTVRRMVNGHERPFSAKEYWLENYATAGHGKAEPNAMWRKRPYGQLAKCAEAQALRMAFPEETGGDATAEEMEGKAQAPDSFQGTTIDAATEYVRPEPKGQPAPARAQMPQQTPVEADEIPDFDAPPPGADDANAIIGEMEAAKSMEELQQIRDRNADKISRMAANLQSLIMTAYKGVRHGFAATESAGK